MIKEKDWRLSTKDLEQDSYKALMEPRKKEVILVVCLASYRRRLRRPQGEKNDVVCITSHFATISSWKAYQFHSHLGCFTPQIVA